VGAGLLGSLAACASPLRLASGPGEASRTTAAATARSATPTPSRDAPAIVTGQAAADVRLALPP
jgi:hypothetical protein